MKPLTALLSQAFAAFTIECDNAFEERVPHRTTLDGDSADKRLPWLVSIGMWALYLRHVDAGGTTIREFARRAGISRDAVRTILVRLSRWWGYVEVEPQNGADRSSWIVRPRKGAAEAFAVWRALPEEVERRWQDRFGAERVRLLRSLLERVGGALQATAPYLPIGNHGMFVTGGRGEPFAPPAPLYSSLARLLASAAQTIERDALLSTAIGDNVMRAIANSERPVRELVLATGCSMRAVETSITYLQEKKFALETRRGRIRVVSLTSEGRAEWKAFESRRDAIEREWFDRAGASEIEALRAALESVFEARSGEGSLLGSGLIPPANGWRAARDYRRQTQAFVAEPGKALAHFPVIAHRGAWPDGS